MTNDCSVLLPVGNTLPNSTALVIASTCNCPEYSITYECTVLGGLATVWKGSAFDCQNSNNEIVLLHNRFNSHDGSQRFCNNGAMVAQSVKTDDIYYTSQLRVTVTSDLIGKSVECHYDDGIIEEVIQTFLIAGTWNFFFYYTLD